MDKEVEIGLKLVMNNAKPAILLESAKYPIDEYYEIKDKLITIADEYNLGYLELPHNRFLVFNKKYEVPEDPNDMDLAKLLDYGCFDPEYDNKNKTRYSYTFLSDGTVFQTFVCTKKVATQFLSSRLELYSTLLGDVVLIEKTIYSTDHLLAALRSGDINNDEANQIGNYFAETGFFQAREIMGSPAKIIKNRVGLLALFSFCKYDIASPLYPVSVEQSYEMNIIAAQLEKSILKDMKMGSVSKYISL